MNHWARIAERGSILGLRLVANCYRLLGERGAKLLLVPVVVYFLVFDGRARRASADYFRRLCAFGGGARVLPAPGWISSFRQLSAFAEAGLHKFAAWLGRYDAARVRFPERSRFDALVAGGRGALLIGAHLGNLEVTRAIAEKAGARVTAVVYTAHAQRFRQLLAEASGRYEHNLVEVSELGPDTMIMLKDRVDRGELLVIVGDRTPVSERGRVCVANFLGSPAPFAQGPYILGALLECPVYLFFCLKEGDGYCIRFEPFAELIELPRRERAERLHAYAQRYAARLEHYCLEAPYQWFNFYNYWDRPQAGKED